MHISAAFRRQISTTFARDGAAWLATLPALLTFYAQRWNLTVGPPFPNLSYNYVAPVVCANGSLAVLKLGVLRHELRTEHDALGRYGSDVAVALLEADLDGGALLLERAVPGTSLAALVAEDDSRATAIAADLMRRLWRPVPAEHHFPLVASWAAGLSGLRTRYSGGTGPLRADLVERAEGLFAELLPSMAEPVLLHGDLHHFNIIAATRRPWLAIDPKGVVGEPAYEAGALLRNPWPALLNLPQPARLMRRRLDQLAAELDLDRERIRSWAIAQAVLSAWWSIDEDEDNRGWDYALACADLLVQS